MPESNQFAYIQEAGRMNERNRGVRDTSLNIPIDSFEFVNIPYIFLKLKSIRMRRENPKLKK